MLFAVAFVAIFILSVALFIFGLRGRRIDDHPLCRRCRFDLSRQPATSDRCPECGTDIRARGAIRIGHRRRRPRLMIGALALFLFVGLPLIGGAIVVARGVWWRAYMPDAYEMLEARGLLPGDDDAATSELLSRSHDGKLSKENERQLEQIVLRQLTQRGVHRNVFGRDWLIGRAVTNQLASADRDALFQLLVATFQFKVRSQTRPGDAPFATCAYNSIARTTFAAGELHARLKQSNDSFTVDGNALPPSETSDASMDMDLTGSSVNSESLTALNALTPGVHEIQRRSVAEVYIETSPSDEPNVILRVPIISHSTVTVLPPGESDVTRVKNEALRPAMEAGITVSQLSERMFTVNFPNAALPADVAFGIYARQNGHEQQISHMERTAHDAWNAWTTAIYGYDDGLVDGPLDIIFRPSETAARKSVDLTQIWDGEIVCHDVMFKRAKPATTSATTTSAATTKPAE